MNKRFFYSHTVKNKSQASPAPHPVSIISSFTLPPVMYFPPDVIIPEFALSLFVLVRLLDTYPEPEPKEVSKDPVLLSLQIVESSLLELIDSIKPKTIIFPEHGSIFMSKAFYPLPLLKTYRPLVPQEMSRTPLGVYFQTAISQFDTF